LPLNVLLSFSYTWKCKKIVVFFVKRYAVRKAKIRPYPERRLNMKQYAIRKRDVRGGGTPSLCVMDEPQYRNMAFTLNTRFFVIYLFILI